MIQPGSTIAFDEFRRLVTAMPSPRIIEFGTRRWHGEATHHRGLDWSRHASQYVLSDLMPGEDVEAIADLHRLEDTFAPNCFDVAIACATWEHLARPWLAAWSLAGIIAPGGLAFVDTHQTFMIHRYPSDYFRFTEEGLRSCFECPEWEVLYTGYSYPAKIIPPPEVTVWDESAPVFLNVSLLAKRR